MCFLQAGLCVMDQVSAKLKYLNGTCALLPVLGVCMYARTLAPWAEWAQSACSRSRFLGLTACAAQSQQSCRASDRRGWASRPPLTPVTRPQTRGARPAHISLSISVCYSIANVVFLRFFFSYHIF